MVGTFDKVSVPQRLKNQSLYHWIVHGLLPIDLEEKVKMDTTTIEELVFRPIDASPHSISKEKAFNNPHFYVDPTCNRKFTKDFPNFKYL